MDRQIKTNGSARPSKQCLPLIAVLFMGLFGCTQMQPETERSTTKRQTNRIVCVCYALQYLTQRIAGDGFSVEFLAEDVADPRNWSPSVQEIGSMQKADLIVANGPGAVYAGWLERVTLDESKICNSCSEFGLKDYITVQDHQVVHSHGPEGEHSHPYFVPFPWLDPNMATQQAKTITKALTQTYPDMRERFEKNLKQLTDDLQAVETQMIQASNTVPTIISLNPHTKYFSRAAGLNDSHLLFFDVANVSDWDELQAKLEKQAASTNSQVVIVDVQPPQALRKVAKESNWKLVFVNLLEKNSGSGDFLSEMQQNFQRLGRAY